MSHYAGDGDRLDSKALKSEPAVTRGNVRYTKRFDERVNEKSRFIVS